MVSVRQFVGRMATPFFITTAIDYTNSPPHIGHAYEKVLADVIARYHRLKGDNVFFLTGVDQHGQKVQQSAAKAGIPPAEFVKEITQKFVDLWKKLDVKYDDWAETTAPIHKKVVHGMLQRLFNAKQIYKDKQAGYYSVRQEQFLTDKERGPDGEFAPQWGQIEFREEENYYFKLEQHKQWLLDLIDKRSKTARPFVVPDFRETELRNAVERLSGDLCISRPKSRLGWGIELPFDRDYVNYVWFDALSNYISFAGYDPSIDKYESQPEEFLEKWPALQIIGKDILVPAHGIYWPIILHALGFPDEAMPQLLVHGWWNLGGAKMSKSAGNVVDPSALIEKYGGDALRLYLTGAIATGWDADFSEERLLTDYNSALANGLGNLVSRTLNMIHRFLGGRLRKTGNVPGPETRLSSLNDVELWVVAHTVSYPGYFDEDEDQTRDSKVFPLPKFQVQNAISLVMDTIAKCDRTIEERAPWKLAKDPSKADELARVLYDLTEAIRILAIWISPVMPKAVHGVFDQLNWKMEPELSGKEERFLLEDAEWGKLPDGHVVGKPVPLFPRIDVAEGV